MTNGEPVGLSVAIGGVLATGVALVALFMPNLTPEMQAAIIAFGNAIILLGSIAWARARTTPVARPTLPEDTQVRVTTPAGEPDRFVTL